MNMDPARKAELMKRVCKLNRIGYDEEASMLGDENNNMSKLEKLLASAEQIKDEDEDLMRRELVNELCDNYSFKSSFEINLPITEKMQKLKTFIASYPFCIIQGNTGKLKIRSSLDFSYLELVNAYLKKAVERQRRCLSSFWTHMSKSASTAI
jgi:hypothetical protein